MVALRAVASVVASLVVAAGSVAPCAAWMPTPDARMLCCDGGACAESHDGPAAEVHRHPAGQPDADRCCGLSAPPQPAPATAPQAGAAPATAATLVPASAVAPVLQRARTAALTAPRAQAGPPRHVLHSVYLI
ncbi:MAG: hypothetical protein AB7O28_07335 [Vicinamibacterales bacterium]